MQDACFSMIHHIDDSFPLPVSKIGEDEGRMAPGSWFYCFFLPPPGVKHLSNIPVLSRLAGCICAVITHRLLALPQPSETWPSGPAPYLDTTNVHASRCLSPSPEFAPSSRITTYSKALDYETTCWHSRFCYYTTFFYATSPVLWTDSGLQKLFGERAKENLNRKQVSQQSSPNATAQKSWKYFKCFQNVCRYQRAKPSG